MSQIHYYCSYRFLQKYGHTAKVAPPLFFVVEIGTVGRYVAHTKLVHTLVIQSLCYGYREQAQKHFACASFMYDVRLLIWVISAYHSYQHHWSPSIDIGCSSYHRTCQELQEREEGAQYTQNQDNKEQYELNN